MVDAVRAIEVYYRPIELGGLTLAISSTSAKTARIIADAVDITASVDCFVEIGNDPTAQVNRSAILKAGFPYRYPIRAGIDTKIAVIGSSSGTLYITPLTRSY
jgi:hypothetical protein